MRGLILCAVVGFSTLALLRIVHLIFGEPVSIPLALGIMVVGSFALRLMNKDTTNDR